MRWKTEHYVRIAAALIFFVFSIFMLILSIGFSISAEKNGMEGGWQFLFLPLLFLLAPIILLYPVIRDYFAPGEIIISLNQAEYRPGDTISGKATLLLKKPTNARAFSFLFYGWAKRGKYSKRIYEDGVQLSGKRVYGNGEEFDFSCKIPEEIEEYAKLPERRDDGLITAYAIWRVELQLDLEKKMDIVESARIHLIKSAEKPASE